MLVEAALVVPLILLLLFGALEYGLLFRDDLTIANMTRAGARSGTAAANTALADYNALSTMAASGTALQGGITSVSYIVIFNADCSSSCDSGSPTTPPRSTVPPSCVTPAAISAGGVTGLCNVYSSAYLLSPSQGGRLATTNFGCKSGVTTLADNFWCPTTRTVLQGASDFLGITISLSHRWVTGMFGTTRTLTDTVVYRIEPQTFT